MSSKFVLSSNFTDMSSETWPENRKQDDTRESEVQAGGQGRKSQQNSNTSIGKHTKSNQKGEELPFYEVRNTIYRPGGECLQFNRLVFLSYIHTQSVNSKPC